MNLSLLLSQLFNGLQTGSIYALVALGYSMVYGIILLLNFAHGDIIMVGAYAAFYAMTTFHMHPIVSVVIAVITSTLLGVVIEKVAYTPLRKAPPKPFMIAQVGQPMQCLTVLPSMGHLRFSSGWPSSNTPIFLSGQSFESS